MNPFNGIESRRLRFIDVFQPIIVNPFNGIERQAQGGGLRGVREH